MPHANRSKKNPSTGRNPTAAEIRQAREAAGLTQTQAAELVYSTLRSWQNWEGGDPQRRMHPAIWAYFLIRLEELKR